MEYIKSSQKWECDNHGSSKIVEIQNLLYKARDDLRKQEATKAEEIVITAKEKLIEAKQSSFPENLQVVDPSDERDLGTRSSNKAVDYVVSNNFERTSRSNIPNYVQCNKQKQGGSLEAPLQTAKYYERKPFNHKWFEHDDRDCEEVEKATAKKFEGANIKSIKISCEAVNRWGHDLYDASQESREEFPGYSKQLFPRDTPNGDKGKTTVDRWGHDLYNATQQTPRSDQELIDFYGYERRQVISNSRYSHGSSKCRTSFQQGAESDCSRPFRGRGDGARSQPRSKDRMKSKKDEILQSIEI